MIREKPYYSVRTGKAAGKVVVDLEEFRELFFATFKKLDELAYFDKAFGKHCVDDGHIPGTLGSDLAGAFLINLRKRNLWPIYETYQTYSEEDLFDVIEFLHDHCAKPLEGIFHNYSGCGYHYSTFDDDAGRGEFRASINRFLRDYSTGYELSIDGEILVLVERGMEGIFTADIPAEDSNIREKFLRAQRKFRHHASTPEDRRDAVRELADILEFLRPQAKVVLTDQDESDLFNLANNFGIRHHNQKQKTSYDKTIWYSWMFYHLSATIHAVLRLIEKAEKQKKVVYPGVGPD